MKRQRSYGDDSDEDVGEKEVLKDWPRRDEDSGRSYRSSHRRFHAKAENCRKGPLADKRLLDDDREPSRSLRKRLDHEIDSFDRRKGGFDRFRDVDDRTIQASSPRAIYGGDRIHRSESFRRDYPKRFRSERDRPRRDGSGGFSWRRSISGKEVADEEVRLASVDSAGRGQDGVVSEDRGRTRSKDSSSGEPTESVDVKKTEELRRESCSNSEMEEGELEPDPEAEQKPNLDAKPVLDSENGRELESGCRIGLEENVGDKLNSSSEMKSGNKRFGEDDYSDGKELETVSVPDKGSDDAPRNQNFTANELNGKNSVQMEEEVAAAADENGDKQRIVMEECSCSASPGEEQEALGKELSVVEEKVSEKQKETGLDLKPEFELKIEVEKNEEQRIDVEVEQKEGEGINLDFEEVECRHMNLETEAANTVSRLDSNSVDVVEGTSNGVTLTLMTDKQNENGKDKGKSLAASLSTETNSNEGENAMEGPSSTGFELVFPSEFVRPEKMNCGGVVIDKRKDEKLQLEPLDLSLGLPGVLLDHVSHDRNTKKPTSSGHARSIQSFPSSFRANSDGFTGSISLSGSQTFFHNPSCCLTQNSTENYEHSVGSRPIFQGIDQVSNDTLWQGQPSNEHRSKGGVLPLYQRILQNGGADQSSNAVNVQDHSQFNGLPHQAILPRQLSLVHSRGSHQTKSEHSKNRKTLTRERNSSSLFRSEQQVAEKFILNGVGAVEKIIAKVISEPVQVVGRTIQELTEESIAHLKETIQEMVLNRENHEQLSAQQETLQRRPDLTLERLSKCQRVLLEILLALKTGLPDFLWRSNKVLSADLAEIFLNLRCRNLACRSILPVDDCDCKVCTQKVGFCSACMCLVCSKFDLASNTCSWVGCDVCLHWCHTDCGLRDSHIRNGQSVTGAQGTTEMQFHCVACGHPSEMFGFVKEVFRSCANGWKADTLARELAYVRKIFSGSNDIRGKRLHDVSDKLLVKLENKANILEVTSYIMTFLAESESNFTSNPNFSPKELPLKNAEGSNGMAGSSKEDLWMPSVSADKCPYFENAGNFLPSLNSERLARQMGEIELQKNLEKKSAVDELESIVKFKQAEAKMYQARADDARREAEGLQCIAIAKNEKIEDEYASRIANLHLKEAEGRRKQKFEELQVLERAHSEYFNMKMRMETEIKHLLQKMEATTQNFNT